MSVAKEKFVTPPFNPAVFSSEAAKAFRMMLEVGSYRHSLRLPRPSNHYGLLFGLGLAGLKMWRYPNTKAA